MASNADFVQYIVDQCSGAGDYLYIEDVDDQDYLARLVKVSLPALLNPKSMK